MKFKVAVAITVRYNPFFFCNIHQASNLNSPYSLPFASSAAQARMLAKRVSPLSIILATSLDIFMYMIVTFSLIA